jgi:predicted AlkP superfamily phosphohydrolase/phosphomutase
MRFLRMLTNAMLAGALGAAYLTVLVLQLNPQVPLLSMTTWRWFATLGLFYGVHLAVTFYVVMMMREFFALDTLSPGWASVRVLAWLAAAAAAVAAVLMWLNVRGFAAALPEMAARRMTIGAAATTASAVVLLAIAVAHYSFGRRGSRVGAALFALAAFGSLALPVAARGRGVVDDTPRRGAMTEAPRAAMALPGPRVTMLLLDGASLEYALPRAAEGRLPNFARVLDNGASIYLATLRPTQPDPVWASVATGMYPARHGIRSGAAYYAQGDSRPVDLLPDHCFSHALVHLGFVRDEPNSSAMWGARPLWSILSDAGMTVGVVRWPLTHPAPPVSGFVVSDRLHHVTASIAEFDRATYPADLLPLVQATASEAAAAALPQGTALQSPEGTALSRDRLYSRVADALARAASPRFLALRLDGLDAMGHHYLRYVQPGDVRGIPEADRRRFAQAVDRYYTFVDGEIGRLAESMAAGDLLLVVSGFGMEPLNPLKRTVGRLLGDPDFSGTHERAPDGFLLAYGDAVEPGRQQRGSVVDVAPTVLYYLGLPIARDMDGYTRADLFTRAFTAERPIAFIPSYR